MRSRSMRQRSRGVSLLEMLLVIALLAAVSVLAATALSGGFRGIQLRSTAKDIASQLRYTRTQAIASGQPQRFTLNPEGHAWTAPNGRGGQIPPALRVTFTGAREVQPSADAGAIRFFHDGAATGGRVVLAIDDAAWQVDVAWLTGEVTVGRVESAP